MKAKVKVTVGYYIDVHEFQEDESRPGYPIHIGDDPKAAKAHFEQEFDKYNTQLREGNLVVELYYQSEKGAVTEGKKWIRQAALGAGQVAEQAGTSPKTGDPKNAETPVPTPRMPGQKEPPYGNAMGNPQGDEGGSGVGQ